MQATQENKLRKMRFVFQKDEDENQIKGLPGQGRRKGQPQEVANIGRARLQVEGAVSKASRRTRG